jgi:hypothetical protein
MIKAGAKGRELSLACSSGAYVFGGIPRAAGFRKKPGARLSWIRAPMCRNSSGTYLRLMRPGHPPGILLHPDSRPVTWDGSGCVPFSPEEGEIRSVMFSRRTVPSGVSTGGFLLGVHIDRDLLYTLTRLFLAGSYSGGKLMLRVYGKQDRKKLLTSVPVGLFSAEPSESDVAVFHLFAAGGMLGSVCGAAASGGMDERLITENPAAVSGIKDAVLDISGQHTGRRIRMKKPAAAAGLYACACASSMYYNMTVHEDTDSWTFSFSETGRGKAYVPVPGKSALAWQSDVMGTKAQKKAAENCREAYSPEVFWMNLQADTVRLRTSDTFPCTASGDTFLCSPEGLIFCLSSGKQT